MFTDKTDFLVNTLEYYTEDTNRRCAPKKGGCYYSPKNAMKEGVSEGCAIGRWLTPENQETADSFGDSSITNIYDKNLLPDWMYQLSVEFLSQCQNLHDWIDNWGSEGLTVTGKNTVERMIKEFNLDKDKLNRFL